MRRLARAIMARAFWLCRRGTRILSPATLAGIHPGAPGVCERMPAMAGRSRSARPLSTWLGWLLTVAAALVASGAEPPAPPGEVYDVAVGAPAGKKEPG